MLKCPVWLLIAGLVTLGSGVSQAARTHAWIVVNPFPLVAAVVAPPPPPPVMVADPYAAPPPPDYRQVLGDFHNRVQRLQRMLDRQLRRGVISQRQYDRHAEDLDAILREEQMDAARHNGALTPREVDDLSRRLTLLQDRVHEDLAR